MRLVSQFTLRKPIDSGLLVCAACCLNGYASRLAEAFHAPAPPAFMGVSPLECVAMFCAFRVWSGTREPTAQGAAHFLAALALVPPSGLGAWTVLFCFASWLAIHSPAATRAGPTLFAVFAAAQLWFSLGFKAFSDILLAVDAQATAATLNLLGFDASANGNVIETGNGHSVAVLVACSSFNRLPILVGATLALIGSSSAQTKWTAVGFVSAGSLVLNIGRLSAMAWSPQAYGFMHGGAGASAFDAVQTAIVLLVALRLRR